MSGEFQVGQLVEIIKAYGKFPEAKLGITGRVVSTSNTGLFGVQFPFKPSFLHGADGEIMAGQCCYHFTVECLAEVEGKKIKGDEKMYQPDETKEKEDKAKDEWAVESQVVSQCGFCDKDDEKTAVIFDYTLSRKVYAMMDEMKGKEWFAYLLGKKVKETYNIKDMVIPEQEVTSASVEVTGTVEQAGVVGTIHSHHSMGAFHSSTDTEFAGANHQICVVVSDKGWAAKTQRDLPCGKKFLADADVYINDPLVREMKKFVEANREKIKEKTYSRTTSPVKQPTNNYGRVCDVCGVWTNWNSLTYHKNPPAWACSACLQELRIATVEEWETAIKAPIKSYITEP